MKAIQILDQQGNFHGDVHFMCPGCNTVHGVRVEPFEGGWGFNNNYAEPTFTPSVLVTWGPLQSDRRCHSFVTDGNIQFLTDCSHELAGQTVPLPDSY